ncbi:type II toxin-antitoxin system RelE/ParE family toxin [Agrobacterium larrymoorei]|uniref:Type II toxin-antitoxin system RelE/ParE family toxin n=1 Tax=Agrobacterium larrymoorei TaxID=160699 RepID=A0AAF0H5S4_9HYPH|nr:type II toxin-antitoxin system RelE/ParE family toxin [Agrobacterium larrymoorei]WHA40276.1 type II toxin-antitoxin system RelE/ParE family toxin [Agrobacterium larrymoorei]
MKRRRLVVSHRALSDLLVDHNYINQFNPTAAKRLLKDINSKMISLAHSGMTGVPRDYVKGLRAFPYRDRCIYFLVNDEVLHILRVLHGHQDISPEDFKQEED